MTDGRSSKASQSGNNPAGRNGAGAPVRKRIVVLEGTFSIEEIDVNSSPRRKAAKATRKQAAAKPATKSKAKPKAKATAKPKTKATAKPKTRWQAKPATKSKVKLKAKAPAKPKTERKAATAELQPLVLTDAPGIKTIAELNDTLAAAHGAASSAVVVDASGVDSIDTAALQLLVAFANSLRRNSRTVEWKNPSAVFCEMAELVDLRQDLGIDEESAAEEEDGLCPVF